MSDRTIGILGLGIFGSSVLAALAKQDIILSLLMTTQSASISLSQFWRVE